MLAFRTAGHNGYGVQYLPFFDNKLAVATAANYGLVGNGRLYILLIEPNGTIANPISWDTQDGLFEISWSENHENQLVAASGDGSIKLFDTTVGQFPVMNWREHEREVFLVNWNLVLLQITLCEVLGPIQDLIQQQILGLPGLQEPPRLRVPPSVSTMHLSRLILHPPSSVAMAHPIFKCGTSVHHDSSKLTILAMAEWRP